MKPMRVSLRRRQLALAGLALPLAACTTAVPFGAPIAPPGERPAPPRARIGDRWRYAEIDLFRGQQQAEVACEVVEITPRVRVRLTDSRGRARPDEVYASAWQVVEEPFYDHLHLFEQPVPLLPPTLAVDERSRTDAVYRVPQWSHDRYDWHQRLQGVAWERVRVPGGEFDTLHVERRIWFTHPDRMRHFSMRWERLWYAPAVNRWVRREWSGEYRWAGMRRGLPLREDWIAWVLLDHVASPVS